MIDLYDFKEEITMKYRVISMILILVLALGLMVPSARAAEPEGQWLYEQIEGGLRLTGYLGDQRVLTLPDTLAGQTVISVGAKCFKGSRLTEVTVPHGIRVIEEEAFAGCKSLKKVHLGGSVNVVGNRAFANTGLIKMDIPSCVRSIGAEAFMGCTSLCNVVIENVYYTGKSIYREHPEDRYTELTYLGEKFGGSLEAGQTMAFMTLALSQVIHAFNMRSDHSIFKIGLFTNKNLNLAALASILMVLIVLLTPVGVVFGMVTLPLWLYAVGAGLVLVPVVIMELSKVLGLVSHKKKN
jgi:hypothetical protein